MESLIDVLAKHAGDGWLWAVGAIIALVANSGIVPWLFGERRRAAEERDQLIERYAKEAEDNRRWRQQDREQYEAGLDRKEQIIERMSEAALLSERGNARLRHLVGNLFQHIAACRAFERRNGLTPVPWDGWREGLNISGDLDDRLRELFGSIEPEPPC